MNEIPVEDVEGAIQATYEATVLARGPVAESIARRQARRTARLIAVAARLEEELGTDAPEVIALRQRIEGREPARVALGRRAERERRRSRLEKGQWMVYGRVVHESREPAVGVRVRLFDKDREFDDLLGETRVDEYGDFFIGPYEIEDFLEAEDPEKDQRPELYVKVYGARNRLLYDGSTHPLIEAGQVEYMEIVLPEQDE